VRRGLWRVETKVGERADRERREKIGRSERGRICGG